VFWQSFWKDYHCGALNAEQRRAFLKIVRFRRSRCEVSSPLYELRVKKESETNFDFKKQSLSTTKDVS